MRGRCEIARIFPSTSTELKSAPYCECRGLGARSVDKIIAARKHRALRFDDLGKMGVRTKLSRYFIQTADQNPYLAKLDDLDLEDNTKKSYQPSLFETMGSASSGEI